MYVVYCTSMKWYRLQYSISFTVITSFLLYLACVNTLTTLRWRFNIKYYKGAGRGGLSAPPSSVVGNALVVIDDGIECEREEPLPQGARVSQHGGQTVNRKMVFGGNLYMVEELWSDSTG